MDFDSHAAPNIDLHIHPYPAPNSDRNVHPHADAHAYPNTALTFMSEQVSKQASKQISK